MDSGELLDAFRADVADREEHQLWSDAEILRYIDEAQTMFCRLTDGIEDSTSDSVTLISWAAGQEWAPISSRILKIRTAYDREGRPIDLLAADRTAEFDIRYRGHQGSRMRALALGFDARALRAYPTPSEPVEVRLSVFRLPLRPIRDKGQRLEIAEHHHYSLLYWMRHLAYNKQDADTFDRRLSQENATLFRQYCAQARAEQSRLRHPVTPIMYGGI